MDGRTYRVTGIPMDWDDEQLEGFLENHKNATPDIHSLFQNLQGTSKTATVTFQNLPLAQNNTKSQIRLPKPSGTQYGPKSYIRLDADFDGLTCLFSPSQEDREVDVIAIAGLGGHAFGSFKQQGEDYMWLRDALPWKLVSNETNEPVARISTYGYNSSLVENKSFQNIEDLATGLRESLLEVFNISVGRPIIFIAHSLGGLILKQTLIMLSRSKHEEYQRLLKRVYGIAFFGVPHHGMDIGSIAALVGNGPARYLIESIGNVNSQVLTSMHRDFIPVLGEEGDTEIFSFYETLESPTAQENDDGTWAMTGPRRVLVTKQSATNCRHWEIGPDNICAINRDHSGMVKFEPGEGKDVSNVSRILGGLAQRATKAPNRTRTDTMFIVPYPENPTFIGRHEAIEAIKRQFGLPKPHQNSKPRTRVAIYGLGGIGKTQVALAFVYWLQSALPDIAVLWVHSSRADRFRQDYVKIAQAYNIPGFGDPKVNVLQHVKTWLETKLRTRWLMVLDNADDLETFFHETDEDDFGISVQDGISRYIPECSHGFILTTTRDKKLGVRIAPGKPPISVGPMGEHESHEYLCKTLDDGTISTADTSALASKLEHLPLAISQAATYITENTITIQKYLQVLDNSDEVLTRRLGEPFAAVGRDSETPHAVTATWILSFRQIEKTSPLGAELLSVMSLYHWQGIPRVLLEKYRENKEGKDKITIPSDIFESSIGTLKAFSLISENKDGELSMHRLVHLVTRNWRLDRKKSNVGVESDYALLASVSLADVLPKNGKDTRGSCLLLLPHAEEIFSTDLGSHEYERLSRGEIALRIGKYCLEEGQWDRAATWHCRAFQAFSRLLGEKNPKSLESGLNLAQAYRSQGQWAKAESLQLEINKSSQEHLEADDPLIQRGMDNLARIYMSQEKFEEAERIHIRLMESFEAKYGSNHAKTLDIMNSLAINYRRQKRLEDAERLQLKLMERSNPNVGNVQNNLAMIYVDQGRWDEAEELLTHAIKDAEKLQEESPFAWVSKSNMAMLYYKQGRCEEAAAIQQLFLKISISTQGADHPSTLSGMADLARTFHCQGRFQEAREMMEECLEKRRKALGGRHRLVAETQETLREWYKDETQD